MKTLLITILLSISIFGQSGKSVLTQAQKDSIGAMISESLAGFTGTYTLSSVVREVGSDRDYTTIASAITAASSGDVIKVFSGTYTEQITVSKNLIFDLTDNAILDYTTASSGATVIVNSGITAKFIGGEIKRTTNTSGASVIFGAGNLELNDTKLTTSSTAALTYHLYLTDGTIKTDNIYCSNPYYNGAIVLNSVAGYINAKQLLGHLNSDSSQVSITTLNWFQKYYGGTANQLSGNSKIILSVKDYWGRIPASGNLDSLRNAQSMNTTAGIELTVQDGVFNFEIYPAGNHTINLINVHCDEGEPAIRFTNNGSNPTAYWNVKGCDLTYSFPSFMDTTQYGGDHIFESNFASNDTNTIYIEIDNSTFRFGDKTVYEGVNDTARFAGNIFQMGWKGWVKASNSTFIQYPETNAGTTAYDFFGNIQGNCEVNFTNCSFINHSQEKDVWMISLTGNYYHKTIFSNCAFYQGNKVSPFAVFMFNDFRVLSANDTIIIDNASITANSFYRTSAGPMTYQNMRTIFTNQKTSSYFNGITSNGLIKGQGLMSSNFTLSAGGLVGYTATDSISRAGVDGDSLKIRIYPAQDIGRTGGYYNIDGITDINGTLYVRRYSHNSYNVGNVLDFRWIVWSPFATMNNNFAVDTVFVIGGLNITVASINPVAGTQISLTTNSDDYFDIIVTNNNAYSLVLGCLLKPSLNIRKIELTRF